MAITQFFYTHNIVETQTEVPAQNQGRNREQGKGEHHALDI